MKEGFKTTLRINNVPIEINPFVEEFLARTAVGAVSSLKGAKSIETVELHLDQGSVKVIVNGNELPLTPFPNDIIANTLVGLVSSLKGVDKVEGLDVSVYVNPSL